ncbi:MAG: hypothetical protein ABI585_12775 [Betaproteobacteria bacterium]
MALPRLLLLDEPRSGSRRRSSSRCSSSRPASPRDLFARPEMRRVYLAIAPAA